MIRLLFGLLAIALCYCADHGTFKDCSRVELCTNLRTQQPSDNYVVDAGTVPTSDNTLTTTLKSNNGGSDLALTLSGLEQDIYRLKIIEGDSTRYELQDVLDGEPEPLNFSGTEIGDNSITITGGSGSSSVKINFSPFSIEFSRDGVSEVVFEGNRLTMARNDVNAPFTFGITYPQAVQLYGIHEHCDNLALQNTGPGGVDPYRMKNSDVAFYDLNSPMALYGAVPVLYGHGPSVTSGVFLHNAAEQWIEINNQESGDSQAYFMVDSGALDIFILLGPKPVDVVRQYTSLTGVAHLPQHWALGFHQSRYSYMTQEEVVAVLGNFTSNNYPLDAIWLDIDYTDSYKYFTWNPSTYSDPITMLNTLESAHKKLVTIIDPHVKVEPGYSVYDGALDGGFFVKNPNGSAYEGPCWPGTSSFMDFLNPDARDFYGKFYSYDTFVSTPTLAGTWNDMNEPSVFDNSIEMTLPADSLHYGGVKHREIHNIYGFLNTIATHGGLINRDNGQVRPFILTRSHFAGTQRYASIWTGDNVAEWPYLVASFQECLNANIVGLVMCGADVTGFLNNPANELIPWWYQAGAWLPFFRSHSNKDTNRREPYLFPEEIQVVIRNAIETRYKHIPVWYTLFFEHTRTGDPIVRPLFYQYPEDVNVYKIDNQLLVGTDILVRAVDTMTDRLQVYFPGGPDQLWVSLEGNDVYAGNGFVEVSLESRLTPVYYRRGSVIVRKDTLRLSTREMADDPYTLYVTLDADNMAYGRVYIDDNVSFDYQNSAEYNYINITFDGVDNVSFDPIDSDTTGDFEFGVEQIVYKEVTRVPEGSTAGVYEEKVYTKDVNGNLFRDVKINPKERTVLKLK